MTAGADIRHEIREWRRQGSAADLRSGNLRRLVALWEGRCGPDGRLPGRGDFDAREFMTFGGFVTLLDVRHDPLSLRFRLVGTTVTQVLGRDVTGLAVDEVYNPDMVPLILETYDHCIRSRAPVSTSGRMKHLTKDFLGFEAIDMPLASDGHHVDMILKGNAFDGVPD